MSWVRTAKAAKRANHKRLSEAEHGLYLIAELASLMARTRLTEWPPDQADLFRRRLREIVKNTVPSAPVTLQEFQKVN